MEFGEFGLSGGQSDEELLSQESASQLFWSAPVEIQTTSDPKVEPWQFPSRTEHIAEALKHYVAESSSDSEPEERTVFADCAGELARKVFADCALNVIPRDVCEAALLAGARAKPVGSPLRNASIRRAANLDEKTDLTNELNDPQTFANQNEFSKKAKIPANDPETNRTLQDIEKALEEHVLSSPESTAAAVELAMRVCSIVGKIPFPHLNRPIESTSRPSIFYGIAGVNFGTGGGRGMYFHSCSFFDPREDDDGSWSEIMIDAEAKLNFHFPGKPQQNTTVDLGDFFGRCKEKPFVAPAKGFVAPAKGFVAPAKESLLIVVSYIASSPKEQGKASNYINHVAGACYNKVKNPEKIISWTPNQVFEDEKSFSIKETGLSFVLKEKWSVLHIILTPTKFSKKDPNKSYAKKFKKSTQAATVTTENNRYCSIIQPIPNIFEEIDSMVEVHFQPHDHPTLQLNHYSFPWNWTKRFATATDLYDLYVPLDEENKLLIRFFRSLKSSRPK